MIIELTYTDEYNQWTRFGWVEITPEQFEYFEIRGMITPSWINNSGETIYQWNMDNADYTKYL